MNSRNSGDAFLSRWSKRKQAVRDAEARDKEAAAAVQAQPLAVPDAGEPPDAPPVPTEEDVEKLTADSDFTAFLKEHVPEHIKRLALRKLWASDPVFSILDGLNEYDDDYTKVQLITQAATSYKIGRGYQPEKPVEEEGVEDAPLAQEEEGADDKAGQAEKTADSGEPDAAADLPNGDAENGDGEERA